MKKESEFSDLEPKTYRILRSIRVQLQKIKSQEELIKSLSEISDFGEKAIEEYIPSENIGRINSLQKEMVQLYDSAFQTLERSSFSEVRGLKKFIDLMKESFLDRIESSKVEIAANLREMGCEFRDKGSNTVALDFLSKALEIDPNSSRNWFERGNLYFDMGDFDSAIRDYQMVFENDPMNPDALCNIGLSLNNMYMFADAKKYFEEALRISPNFREALVGKGQACMRLEEFADAEVSLQKALRLDPNDVETNLLMGVLEHEDHYDREAAKGYAEKALDLDPSNILAKANLAEILLAFGKNEYNKSALLSSEVLETGLPDLGYSMRLVKVCSLYFGKKMEEATKAALDLIKYYDTTYDKVSSAWKFIGLRKTVTGKKDVSGEVKSLLNKLIDLAETPDVNTKKRLLKDLPELIKSIAKADKVAIFIPPFEREIVIKNVSEPDLSRTGYYNWEIFLDVPEHVLSKIVQVKYILHPTFGREREIIKENRDEHFRLERNGYAEFVVKVIIILKEGQELTEYYWLKLGALLTTLLFQSKDTTRFHLRRHFIPGRSVSWFVTRYRGLMHPGQIVLLWNAKGKGSLNVKGLYGWGITTGEPQQDSTGKFRINVKYVERWVSKHDAVNNVPRDKQNAPVSAGNVLALPSWKGHQLATMPIGTNFLVTQDQLNELLNQIIDVRFPSSQLRQAVNSSKYRNQINPSEFKHSLLFEDFGQD